MRTISITKYLDEQCRGVTLPKNAAYEDISSIDGSRLRFMDSYADTCIKKHLKRDNVIPLGECRDGEKRTIGNWTLSYDNERSIWNGSSGNVDVAVCWDTDDSDLQRLLGAFDRVANNSSAFDQPRRIVMEVGLDDFQSAWGVAKTTSGKISWRTDGGLIPIVAVDNQDQISNLDRVICHEITHLMEPELREPLEELTQLLLKDRFVTDDEDTVSLSGNHKEAIIAINPDYFPHHLKEWGILATALEISHRRSSITPEAYAGQSHSLCQELAAEIISETACSRFWNLPSHPKGKESWVELERAIFFATAEMDISMKSPMSSRLSRYECDDYDMPPRGLRVRASPSPRGFVSENHRDSQSSKIRL